jgi:hypothetical protein
LLFSSEGALLQKSVYVCPTGSKPEKENIQRKKKSFKLEYIGKKIKTVTVPDKRSRIHEVVVVRRYQPGFWEFGVGREWGGLRKGRSVYE